MSQTLRQAAGSVMVVGLSGTELTGLEQAWLRLVQPAGVILFRRNIVSAQQTRNLLLQATTYCRSHAMRCVDIEGGTVDRLRDAVAPMPSAQAVARTGKAKLAELHGKLIGREAAAFGFNTTLAPVLDLGLQASAAVMGSRTAGATPDGVVAYARAFLAGLKAYGVAGCAKHYPGLGGGTLDSHHETPAIERTWKELWQEDLAPYRELADELPMVMVNHATYPRTSSANVPATASAYWATAVLQKRMGYRGLIFSDDMEMGGILKFAPIEEAAILGMRAGIHVLEICHSPELILRCYESLLREAERSVSFRKILLERARTGSRLRKARLRTVPERTLTPGQLAKLREHVLRFSGSVEASSR